MSKWMTFWRCNKRLGSPAWRVELVEALVRSGAISVSKGAGGVRICAGPPVNINPFMAGEIYSQRGRGGAR